MMTRKSFRRRFWMESVFAVAAGILALVTPVFPDWIEVLTGWDPDQHDGSVERYIVVGLFIITTILFALAFTEWRRTPRTVSG
jgi:hypothetical protein